MKSSPAPSSPTPIFVALRTIAFIAAPLAAAFVLAAVCDHAARSDSSQKIVWTFAREKESFDFLVAGSSRANTATDAESIGKILHAKGINIGEDGASYLESEAVLKHFLNRNRACSLLMEVDSFGLSSKMETGVNLWKYAPFLGDPYVDEYLHSVAGAKFYLWKWIPFAKYAEFNGRIGWRSVYHMYWRPPHSYDESGNSLLDGGYVEPVSQRTRIIVSDFDSTMTKSLARIVRYAQGRGKKSCCIPRPSTPPPCICDKIDLTSLSTTKISRTHGESIF